MNNRYIVNGKITNEFVENYTKTTYRIIGENKHSAIKPCHWLEQRLMTGRDNRNCYKSVFGIQSHRCLQNTPSMPFCNHQCVFCWRDIELGALGGEFSVEPDDPKDIVDEMIRHHQDILTNHLPLRRYLDNYEIMNDILYFMLKQDQNHSIGSLSTNLHISKNKVERAVNLLKNQRFIKATGQTLNSYSLDSEITCCLNSKEEVLRLVNRALTTPDEIMQAHAEAMHPNHAAISLDGEPLLYPKIEGLVEEFRNRQMTTFIVTNGTLPEVIVNMDVLPSQLYLTIPAPNEKIYKKTCRPMVKNGWDKIMKSLELLDSLSCRTLVRLTAVKNLNISNHNLKEYYELVKKANPDFFEIKGFTLQAKALMIKERLKSDKPLQHYFPEYEFLKAKAKKFEEISNYPLIYSNEPSRDFLFTVRWNRDKDPVIKVP